MRIYVREIKEQPIDVPFSEKETWAVDAIAKSDERREITKGIHVPSSHTGQNRPLSGHFQLMNVDGVIVITGRVDSQIQLLCSRCATAFKLDIHPRFRVLFSQDPVLAGVHTEAAPKTGKYPSKTKQSGIEEFHPVSGRVHGKARHAHDEEDTDTTDISFLTEDHIDLGQVLHEQIQLTIPYAPLCKPDCKGICPQCGADWNVGKCACAKLNRSSPFSALQNLPLKGSKPGSSKRGS